MKRVPLPPINLAININGIDEIKLGRPRLDQRPKTWPRQSSVHENKPHHCSFIERFGVKGGSKENINKDMVRKDERLRRRNEKCGQLMQKVDRKKKEEFMWLLSK